MIYTLFWTVTFCLGWRLVTAKDNILYFLKRPFENAEYRLEYIKEIARLGNSVNMLEYVLYKLMIFIGTPFILCITCMSSIWGASIFILLNGFNKGLIVPLVLNSFAAAFIQTFIWRLYDRISNE